MLTSAFEDFYFDNTFLIAPVGPRADLGSVVEGSQLTLYVGFTYMLKSYYYITLPGLEDYSFLVTGERLATAAGEETQAGLASQFVAQGPTHAHRMTLEFTHGFRSGAQETTFGYADVSVPLSFERLPVITSIPRASIRESLKFKTSIEEAWDGTETRMRLRPYPRSEVTMRYFADQDDVWEAVIDSMGMGSQYALVPMHHRSEEVNGIGANPGYVSVTIAAGDLPDGLEDLPEGTPLAFYDTSAGDIKVGLLYDQATSTTIRFSTDGNLPTPAVGDLLLPTETARMVDNSRATIYPSKAAEVESTWISDRSDVVDGNLLDASTEFNQFEAEVCDFDTSKPIVRNTTLSGGSLVYQSDSGAIIFDRQIGRSRSLQRRATPQIQFSKSVEISWDPAQASSFRKFLMWTWGRQRSFYISSDADELVPFFTTSNQMTFQNVGNFSDRLPLMDGVVGFDVLKTSGAREQYRVDSYIMDPGTSGGTLLVTLDRAPGAVGLIESVSLLYHVRLGTDDISMNYDGRGTLSCELPMITVKQ